MYGNLFLDAFGAGSSAASGHLFDSRLRFNDQDMNSAFQRTRRARRGTI